MRTAHLLCTAATALLLSAGMASAQTSDKLNAEPAPPAIKNAPAEKIAPPMNAGQRPRPETTGQGTPDRLAPGSGANTQMDREPSVRPSGKAGADVKGGMDGKAGDADLKADADVKAGTKSSETDTKADRAETKSPEASKTGDSASKAEGNASSHETTGQGAAAGAAKLSAEQRSEISATLTKQSNVKRLKPADINISINVGTRVPSHIHYYPLPRRVVTIYPEWDGYYFILVGDQIVIIAPSSREIIAILPA